MGKGACPKMGFEGKVAIVTGSGRGIGRATVLKLAKGGAKCCIAARTLDEIEAVKQEVENLGGQAITVPTDVSDPAQIRNMIARTVEAFGRLDILVNNAAGGRSGPSGPQGILECSEEDWQATINGSLTQVYRASHYALPHIIKSGGGAIVNVSSTRGLSGRKASVAYGSAKAAVINLTRCMALDLLEYNVRVNCVCPGHVANEHMAATADLILHPEKESEILAEFAPPAQAKIRQRAEYFRVHPDQAVNILGRGFTGYPKDLANVIVFLASDEASFVNGEVVAVDGGSSAGK